MTLAPGIGIAGCGCVGAEPAGTDVRRGGGGGVPGARGVAPGDVATLATGTDPVDGGEDGGVDARPDLDGGGGGLRSGGGGGAERNPLGVRPRAEGGGGMRDAGAELASGRGAELTGLGATLTGASAAAEDPASEAVVGVASFSSPIGNLAPMRGAGGDCTSKPRNPTPSVRFRGTFRV